MFWSLHFQRQLYFPTGESAVASRNFLLFGCYIIIIQKNGPPANNAMYAYHALGSYPPSHGPFSSTLVYLQLFFYLKIYRFCLREKICGIFFFWIWLILGTTTISSPTYFWKWHNFFLFMAKQNSTVYIHHIFCHSFADGHPGWLHDLAIVTCAAINMNVQICHVLT